MAERPFWREVPTGYRLNRRFTTPDGTSMLIRRMLPLARGESGAVAREIWDKSTQPSPVEFSSDKDLAHAVVTLGLPSFPLRKIASIRRSVAARAEKRALQLIPPDEPLYIVMPEEINARRHFWDAFDHMETEIAAGYIVRFCQQRGKGWKPFTREEIESFYKEEGHEDGFNFRRLIYPGKAFSITNGLYLVGGGWVTVDEKERYHITEEFVQRVYESSPADPVVFAQFDHLTNNNNRF